jgi:phosphoribosylformimino-5-aminoimidazole carboxamide ribotide isomerase
MSLVLYPAIDVRDGRVVRLRQGDYARETRYPETPLAHARRYAAQGADWLHLVDLDGAREGRYTLLPLLPQLAAAGLRVQTGGGIRDAGDIQRMLDAGASRVVVGSLAIREPDLVAGWIARFGAGALVVALDARRDPDRRWRLPVAGWTAATDASLAGLARRFEGAGLCHLLSTDIARDGMLAGPGLALYRELRAACPRLALQASGGIRDAADLAAVEAIGCAGAVLGRSLLEGGLARGGLPGSGLEPAELRC